MKSLLLLPFLDRSVLASTSYSFFYFSERVESRHLLFLL